MSLVAWDATTALLVLTLMKSTDRIGLDKSYASIQEINGRYYKDCTIRIVQVGDCWILDNNVYISIRCR